MRLGSHTLGGPAGLVQAKDFFLRSDFSSSRLVRLLGAWSPASLSAAEPGMDFAERLGLWVSAFDAIKLQAAQRTERVVPAAPARQVSAAARALHEQMQRVRAALAHAIAQDPLALAGADPMVPAYAPFQRRHAELQRHMEQMLLPLREQVRLALSQAGGPLPDLARLDAAVHDMLAPREQQLLATLPAHLARRFDQLRQQASVPDWDVANVGPAPESRSFVHWTQESGSWLAAFSDDWQQALLAELDLRLEPVTGLLAALNNEVKLSS